MSTYLLSPSESKLSDKLGVDYITSPIPESKGADILLYTNYGIVGIQRKEVPHDFLASIADGRLARETSLLSSSCKFGLLLLEGHFKYWPDGRISLPGLREPSRFTRAQVRGILFDTSMIKGVAYDHTDDIDDTISYIRALDKWMNREKHMALFNRPSGPKGTWIVPSAEESQSWILQGFEGIGPALASAIIEHFGKLPLTWTCSLGELMKVPKLSSKRAQYLWSFLSQTGRVSRTPVAPAKEAVNEFDILRRRLAGG